MMASGRFADYLGKGVIGDRPAAPVLLSYMVGLWYSTDTLEWSAWNGAVWLEDIMAGGGMTNPMTTAEDIIVGGTAGAPARLGIGTDGQVLTVVAGALAYATPSAGTGDVVGPASAVTARIATFNGTTGKLIQDGGKTIAQLQTQSISIACSDETTALTTGTAKVTFRMPYAFTLTAVRASVTTAPTGSVLTVDINEGGSTILSPKITIDATEKTSTTAATPPVISDTALADDAEITIDIDTVGSTVAGAGLKVYLIGYAT